MSKNYLSFVRSYGDYGAAFESTKESAMFYLLDLREKNEEKIVTYIPIWTGKKPSTAKDLKILPSSDESAIGLFINKELWAAFDISRSRRSGGNFEKNGTSSVSDEIREKFFK